MVWLLYLSDPMILAARFTTSPSTENSFLDPEVPTTPLKTSPEEIPILHEVSILESSLMMLKPVRMARAASSSCDKGQTPHKQMNVLPLSSITSLFTDPCNL